jgi:hypothetical protein
MIRGGYLPFKTNLLKWTNFEGHPPPKMTHPLNETKHKLLQNHTQKSHGKKKNWQKAGRAQRRDTQCSPPEKSRRGHQITPAEPISEI